MGRAASHERMNLHAGGGRSLLPARRHAQAHRRPGREPRLGQVLRLIAKHGDEVFYEGEIAHAIVEDMRATAACSRPTISGNGGRCGTRRSGAPTAATACQQPPARRRRDAARDAEHSRAIRARRARAQLRRVHPRRRGGDEARDDRQGPPYRRPRVRRRARRSPDRQGVRGRDGQRDPRGQKADVPRFNGGAPGRTRRMSRSSTPRATA